MIVGKDFLGMSPRLHPQIVRHIVLLNTIAKGVIDEMIVVGR